MGITSRSSDEYYVDLQAQLREDKNIEQKKEQVREEYMFPKFDLGDRTILRSPYTIKKEREMKQLECVCSYCGSTKTTCEQHYEDKKGATHTTRTYFNKHTCKDCGCEWLTVRGDSRSILSDKLVATYWILGIIFIILSTYILNHYGVFHNKDCLMGYSAFTGVIYTLIGFYLIDKTEEP